MDHPSHPLPVLLLLFLASACGPGSERDAAARADSAAAEAAERAGLAVAETIRRADSLAAAVEDTLRPVPLMRPPAEAALRRYLNDAHVARARALGVRAGSAAELEALVQEGRLVLLEDSTRHWIVRERRSGSPDYVVPHTRALLEELGERFHRRLASMGLPPYRMEITSALRTAATQAALRRDNPNAAAGVSSHEFGTTVDIAYSAYAPPAELPEVLRVDAPSGLAPHLERIGAVTLESVSARKSRELKVILGEVLQEAQNEGLVLVILERYQPVFHITVGRALAEG